MHLKNGPVFGSVARCMISLLVGISICGIICLASNANESADCQTCHPTEYELWTISHHALAERMISTNQDRAAFEPSRPVADSQVRFRDAQFEIFTLGPNTNFAPFPVKRVIGVEPVRQFLTPTINGCWQTQQISYGTRSNQWFDVYAGENRQPGEWGHWTGRGMNWNSMCAECHNTRLEKNYDVARDSYYTTMSEMGVGCEACHGFLTTHNVWQKNHPGSKLKDPTIQRLSPQQTLATCGSCHSRRDNLTGDFVPGASFSDHYSLQTLDETEQWYADGQVHGEDYEFVSFISSKMSQSGVTCMDCHDPHSGKTRLAGNDLCMRCHVGAFPKAPIINPAEHEHHQLGGDGNSCVGCHMPVTVYMQRHPRRDHGFTIPDPLLTKELNIPNACNRCHMDKTANWSLDYVQKWYGDKMNRHTRDRARWIAAGQRGDSSAKESLIKITQNQQESFYWRSVAAGLLWQWAADSTAKTALFQCLNDPNPLVREKAVSGLEPIATSQNADVVAHLQPLLSDPSRNVRIAAAWMLKEILDLNSRAGIDLQHELAFNADQPEGQYRLATFSRFRGQPLDALAHLQKAMTWDPLAPALPARAAEILVELGRYPEAIAQWQTACRLKPTSADFQLQLGLAEADGHEITNALNAFRHAVKLDQQNSQAWYNLGLALSAEGEIDKAVEALKNAESLSPGDPQIPYARASILFRAKRYGEAEKAAEQSLHIQADFEPARFLLKSLASLSNTSNGGRKTGPPR